MASSYSASDSYKKGRVVSSSGKYFRSLTATSGTPTSNTSVWEQLPVNYNPVIRSPDNRPFFASAGPDGDFSKGDDNLYSFEQ